MKRSLYKIACFSLLVACLLCAFCGCAGESDEAFLETATLLLEKTKAVNAICFGEGILPLKDGYTAGKYTQADPASLQKHGVSSYSDIRAMIDEVYSVATADYVTGVVLEPVKTDTGYASLRRYYEAVRGEQTLLMVLRDVEPLTVGEAAYQNVRLLKHDRARGEILVDIVVTYGNTEKLHKDVPLSLRKEEGAWRFDTVTYASAE